MSLRVEFDETRREAKDEIEGLEARGQTRDTAYVWISNGHNVLSANTVKCFNSTICISHNDNISFVGQNVAGEMRSSIVDASNIRIHPWSVFDTSCVLALLSSRHTMDDFCLHTYFNSKSPDSSFKYQTLMWPRLEPV
uniref:Uncharacterized protein n=1 Tax=Cacopsylla melanoneura TaxID=428564 RepID=A0A8D8PK82_9HEMI